MVARRQRYFIKIFFSLIFLTGLWSIAHWVLAQNNATATNSKTAILLDIKGGIGPATQDFISRGIKKAADLNASAIILRIDTPGGLSKSMRYIIKDILSSPVPVISYVAPSGARAASAGTYILYASHVAAMAPGTNLGAATPVAIGTPGGKSDDKDKEKQASKKPSASEKKALNDARAYIRSLAQLRGRNVKWAEKAVVEAESLSAKEALKLNVINFIAIDIPDLLKKANGMKVDIQGKSSVVQTEGVAVQQIQPDWRTKFLAVITDPSVAYILLMIGFYGIFFEFMNPGFVVPGVVGAIALLLALYSFALLPINYVGLGLIILGIAFIVAEAFVPSFGALGIGGVISFVIGSIMLLKTKMIGYIIPMYLIIIIAIVTVVFFLLVLSMALRSRRRPVVSGREAVVGQRGKILISDERIWVRIEGERWQCRSHVSLKEGQEVVVKSVEGLILVVEPVSTKQNG